MNENLKIALIDKGPSSVRYDRHGLDFQFTHLHLCSKKLTKVLKRDVDLQYNPDDYDFIITVGSEASKYCAGVTSVTDYAGYLVDDKYIPLLNPAMLIFKPEVKPMFDKAVEKLKEILEGNNRVSTDGDFRGIQDADEAYEYLCLVDKWAEENGGVIATDTETTGLYPRDGYVLGISISAKLRTGAYIDSDCIDERVYNKFQELFNKYKVVFHNSKFDLKMLEYHFGFVFKDTYEDTLIIHYLLDETQGSHGLKQLAIKFTDYGDYDRALSEFKANYCRTHKILQEDFTYNLIPFEIISTYAAIDTAVTLELYFKFSPILRQNQKISWVYDNLMIPGSTTLKKIEEVGIPMSRDRLEFARVTLDYSLQKASEELYSSQEVKKLESYTGKIFNPNSVPQLRQLLFDVLNLDPLKKLTGTGEQSTDAEVLESLVDQHPIVEHILKIRKLNKIKNTYIDKIIQELDKDGRIRTGFNLTSTTSGRLSSSGKFNAQQIPRDEPRVKGCIVAPEGYVIVSQDLATAEMYYAAVLSGDKNLQNVFLSGGDFHSSIAKQVFNLQCPVEKVKELFPMERQAAKAVSFGILYGSGPQKVSDTVTKESGKYFSKAEAQDVIDLYFDTYKALAKWLNVCKAEISARGFCYTSFGRKRRLKNVFSTDKAISSHEVRSGINAMVQSLASDINLFAAIDTLREVERRQLDANIFMLVHDSIVSVVRKDHLEEYNFVLASETQKDRGFSIPAKPIGIDQEAHADYSFGKFDKKYGEEYAKFIKDPLSYIPSPEVF